jgi:isoquinoline 1-oxidoreductase beta subunit
MKVAVIARPPVFGGAVASFDPAPALAIAGVVKVVQLPASKTPPGYQPLGGVAVIADHTWAAMRGRDALTVTWHDGPNADHDSATYREALAAAVRVPGQVVRKTGDVAKALAAAARVVEAEYHVPHLVHQPIEPPAALAEVRGGKAEVWLPTQDPQVAQAEIAAALGLKPTDVTVHVTFLGGSFGRKSKPDHGVEAALLARAAGVPVRVQWTRPDELRHAYYHAASVQHLAAGLDAQGHLTAWRHRTAFPAIGSTFASGKSGPEGEELSMGATDLPLAIPNVQVEAGAARPKVRIGWLRSVSNIQHAFATQSFIAELATAMGRDHREVLLEVIGADRHLTPKEAGTALPNYGMTLQAHPIDTARLRGVIERVTAAAGWAQAKASGRALGLAAHRSFLSYTAAVVEVVRAPDGGVRVAEIWMAADCGLVVNRDRARAQLEGSAIFGLTTAFHGAITMKRGAVEQRNFRDAPIARIGEVPARINVDLVDSEAAPGGVGEPGFPPIAPAICNAVFALTGKRVRDLPLAGKLG